ncbi:MAG: S9 family peptidase [Betaproteobacteria bacterium]|nr:S9 family peptidase [Betaproteobacteria bacterium]
MSKRFAHWICVAWTAGATAMLGASTPTGLAPAPVPAITPTPPPPPPLLAAERPVTETYFGRAVTDPYRYMESVRDPEVVSYLKAQSAHARAVLDTIPGRKGLVERIAQLSESGVQISAVQMAGRGREPVLFYLRQAPGERGRKLYTRNGLNGPERLVFDPDAAAPPGQRWSIDSFSAAPDGAHVLVGTAAGGSEETVFTLLHAASAKPAGPPIDRIAFGNLVRWAGDSRSFFYNRLPPQETGAPPNRYLNSVAWRHVIGRPVEQDEPIMGIGRDPKVALKDIDIPDVRLSPDGKTLIADVRHGDLTDLSVYVAPATPGFKPPFAWRRVIDPSHGVVNFVTHQNFLYVLTHQNAPNYKLLRLTLPNPDMRQAVTVLPNGDTVLKQISVAQDALYVRELFGGVDRLQRLNFGESERSGGKLEYVRLPFDLAIRQLITSPARPGAFLRLEGWTEPPRYAHIEAVSGNLIPSTLQPKSNVNFDGIDEVRLKARAKDGVIVPVSLIYKSGTKLDTLRPTLLRAYGAYGITQNPTFDPATLAWLERGGVLGTCHVRGGGEFGEAWHKGGQKLTKPNTWRDLIACAEFLVERQFTRPERMAIMGGSAGGITVGRALTERPDLFAAVVPRVGMLDTLRAEFTPNGPPNIPEFGSVTTEDGFKGLLAMSSLQHVVDGTKYPAVLLMHGVNDPRVEVWHSAKMAARLQKAVAGVPLAPPVLLRLDYDAGHGVGTSRSQRVQETADIYAFLLWQFDDPEFQPTFPPAVAVAPAPVATPAPAAPPQAN